MTVYLFVCLLACRIMEMSMELRLLNWTWCCVLESALEEIKHHKRTE